MEKGIEKGIEKGMKKGIEKGEKKAKIEIAKNLLSAKVDINTIVISTGLSVKEIETIKNLLPI
jgi:predicted transposase/invertase (TIGR01784 family)